MSWRKRSSHYALCTNHYALIFNSQTAYQAAGMRRIRLDRRQPEAEFFGAEAFELSAPVPVPGCNSFLRRETAEPVGRQARLERAASCGLRSVTREYPVV